MADWLRGTWQLVAWRRIAADGTVTYPLGTDARGQLIYTSNDRMAVQITAASRPRIAADDPLGGEAAERAAAYSTYLAYFGTYEVQGEQVIHHLDGSLFPNWSGAEQDRPIATSDNGDLILRTQPMKLADGKTVVNELAWNREKLPISDFGRLAGLPG